MIIVTEKSYLQSELLVSLEHIMLVVSKLYIANPQFILKSGPF